MPLEKESLNNFLPDGFETNNLEGAKENFSADKIATGYEKDVKDRVSGPNFNNLLDVIGKNTNVLTKFMDFIKNMPVNNLFAVDENNQLVYKNLDEVGGGGLEIGDIGIAPLGVDESKGKRRYLNGQIIIQEQYQTFTAKLKEAVALYPTLSCSESEWQATALLTVGGQVGKFVVDNDAGTIRLPKIIMPIQGLTDLSKLGEIVEAGLPNIEGWSDGMTVGHTVGISTYSGAFTKTNEGKYGGAAGSGIYRVTLSFDASKSNPIYGNSTTVQQEQIQYPYFIQVATGAETEDNIINEIELNNPYSFGDSKYSPVALNNLSWLKSEGQYNPKAVYPAYYDWALINANNGVEGFKFITDEYTDYDVVINPADETFRLPLLDGSEDLISTKYTSLTFNGDGSKYTAPANGWYLIQKQSSSGGQSIIIENQTTGMKKESAISTGGNQRLTIESFVNKGDIISIGTASSGSTNVFKFIYAQGNGSLYFYVGETVQNANLINAGRIEEIKANKADIDGMWTNNFLILAESQQADVRLEKKYDLTDYLPKDGNIYEVIIGARGYTLPQTGAVIDYSVRSSIITSNVEILRVIARTNLSNDGAGNIIIPIGQDRILTFINASDQKSATNGLNVYLYGYRKVR